MMVAQLIDNAFGNTSPNEIAQKQRGMKTHARTLAAGVSVRIEVDGDYFHVFKAPVNDLTVAFDDGEPEPVEQGIGFRRYFKSITLSSATGQAVKVYAGFGSVGEGRSTASVTTTVNIAPGATLSDGGDVSCPATVVTQLLAADANRLYALLQNASTNTLTVRIGTATVGAATGTPLEPGQTLPLATTAAIYAYNPGAGAVTISAAAVKV
jgi:hypothetical protein